MAGLKNLQQAVQTLESDAVKIMPPVAMLGVLGIAFRAMWDAAKPPPEKRMG